MGYETELRCPEPIFIYPKGMHVTEFDKIVLEVFNRKEVLQLDQFQYVSNTDEDGRVTTTDLLYYFFRYNPDTGSVAFGPCDEEYFGKHYGYIALAKIISILIPRGQRTWLEFIGEDGERWGYAIEHMNVMGILYEEYVETTEGKISIFDWVESVKWSSPEEERKYRKLNIQK